MTTVQSTGRDAEYQKRLRDQPKYEQWAKENPLTASDITADQYSQLITCPSGKVFATERLFGHTSHPTFEELQLHADGNGLQVRSFWNWGFPFYRLVKIATNINPKFSMRHFGSGPYSFRQRLCSSFLYWLNFCNFRSSSQGCQIFCLMQKLPRQIEMARIV